MENTFPPDDEGQLEEASGEEVVVNDEAGTAVIKVAPAEDAAIQALYEESRGLLRYAESRVITVNEDLKSATDDLSLIAKLRKAIEEKRKEYIGPIRERLDAVNAAFKEFMAPLEGADCLTRDKILAFRQEQERKRQEAEAIEREKLELARREAELNGGEITIDLSEVEKPEAVPDRVRTEMGTAGTMKVRKYRVVDFSKLPDQYKIENSALLNRVVKAGIPEIPGVEIYVGETLRVSTR